MVQRDSPDQQLYGSHPMYLRREKDGNFHIVFLRSASGMQLQYKAEKFLKYKVISGIIDLKFFLGGKNPEPLIEQYHKFINGWILHPFWY